MKAIERKIHILVEKPIALTSDEGRRMVDAARSGSIVLAIGHIERFNPAFAALTRSLGGKAPELIDIKRFSPLPARITDASVVADMMIHDIDLACFLAGSKLKDLKSSGSIVKTDKLDTAHAVLFFENGVVANIEASRVHGEKIRSVIAARGQEVREADLLNRKAVSRVKGKAAPLAVEAKDQLNEELKDFVSAVLKKCRPAVNGEDGLAALEIAEKIERTALAALGSL